MKQEDLEKKILLLLTDQLGLETGDINEDDSLISDLHMRPSDLSDFVSVLEENDIDTTKLDLTQIETVGELLENLTGGF